MLYISFILFFSVFSSLFAQGFAKGKITTLDSNKPLSDCNIFVLENSNGTISDSLGNYKITLEEGEFTLRFSHIGYKTIIKKIIIDQNNFILNIQMEDVEYREEELIITAKRDPLSIKVQEIEQQELKKMPRLYSDVLRTVQSLPGVSSNNELSSAYNVRGGNYDENLIYLNGYEIYRPFLLKIGIEESQSLINPDMVKELEFYNGSFPVVYGDKMSSALAIEYSKEFNQEIGAVARANMLNSGLSINNKYGDLNWTIGIRYGYPGMFLQKLQTSGLYKPSFADIQILANYPVSQKNNLELFVIDAYNKFDLTPEKWVGHFQSTRSLGDASAITLEYDGGNVYKFYTRLFALKDIHRFTSTAILSTSASAYFTTEMENTNLRGNYYYSPSAEYPYIEREFLKTRDEFADNKLDLSIYEIKSDFLKIFSKHSIRSGISFRLAHMYSKYNEYIFETDSNAFAEDPEFLINSQKKDLNSISFYVQDNILFSKWFQVNVGIRSLYYNYNKEFLISPRATISFLPFERHIVNAGFGVYYQPPFFYELRNNSVENNTILKSQKALHYTLSWEYKMKENGLFLFEFYYKQLSRIIPYYIEQLKLKYLNENSKDAYAYGFDVQYRGEIRKGGLKNWFSYSFLNTKEKNTGKAGGYFRRLLDQRHTIQVFLQDRIPNHPNWQSHLRLSFGSGYLTNGYLGKYSSKNGTTLFDSLNYDKRIVLPFYMRADMGLSTTFNFENNSQLIVTIEVLNVLNKYNIAGYNFIQAFKDINWPVSIPQIFSKRFFNVGIEYSF